MPTPAALARAPRTFTSAREAVEDVCRLWLDLPVLGCVYLGRTLDSTVRERVMVAVSRANACAGCTAVHERWALHAGVTAAELEAIGLGELARLDDRSRAAVVYATALAERRFRAAVDDDLLASVRRHLSDSDLRGVEAVARMIALANLTANGFRNGRRRAEPRLASAAPDS